MTENLHRHTTIFTFIDSFLKRMKFRKIRGRAPSWLRLWVVFFRFPDMYVGQCCGHTFPSCSKLPIDSVCHWAGTRSAESSICVLSAMPCVHMLLGQAPMLPSSKLEQVDLCMMPFYAESQRARSSKAGETATRLSCCRFAEDTAKPKCGSYTAPQNKNC